MAVRLGTLPSGATLDVATSRVAPLRLATHRCAAPIIPYLLLRLTDVAATGVAASSTTLGHLAERLQVIAIMSPSRDCPAAVT